MRHASPQAIHRNGLANRLQIAASSRKVSRYRCFQEGKNLPELHTGACGGPFPPFMPNPVPVSWLRRGYGLYITQVRIRGERHRQLDETCWVLLCDFSEITSE